MEILMKVLPVVVSLLSGLLLAKCTYMINRAEKERDREKEEAETKERAMAEGVQALLREKIVDGYNKYQEKGYCPIFAKESAKRLYKAYSQLGGNDVAHELYTKLLAMPTEPEDTPERGG